MVYFWRFAKKNRRIISITYFIVLYILILCMISSIKNPQLKTVTKYLAGPNEFAALVGDTKINEDSLFMHGEGDKVFGTEVNLSNIKGFNVSFNIDCPTEYAGVTIYIDLYNIEANYDSPQSEFAAELRAGSNIIEGMLNPGNKRPDKAILRIFATKKLDIVIKNVSVQQLTVIEAANIPLYIEFALAILLSLSLALFIIKYKIK